MPVHDLMFTELYMNHVYTVFDSLIYNLLIAGMVPITMLIYMYAKIYRHIKKHNANLAAVLNRMNERERKKEADLGNIHI